MNYRITISNSGELFHYGIKGMHWGIRRFQDYDGTRISTGDPAVTRTTPGMKTGRAIKSTVVGGQDGKAKGLARVAAAAPSPMGRSNTSGAEDAPAPKKKSAVDAIAGPNVKKGKGKENSSHAKEMLNDLGNAAEGASNLAQNLKKRDKKVQEANERAQAKQRKKASQMSDKELRDSINRIKMEREYTSLTTKEVKTGYDKFQDVMHDVKDLAVTAGAIAGLILSIIKIKQALHSAIDSEDEVNELYHILDTNDFDEEVAIHALALDEDFIIDYYDLDKDEIMHMIDDSEDYLMHHGIKGQKWGVRRFQNLDGTRIKNAVGNTVVGGQGGKAIGTARVAATAGGAFGAKKSKVRADGKDESTFTPEQKRISKDAKKDAEEFARAKAFYGEGAGNRRKAIKTTVEAKKKKSEFYGEEFEYHLSQQDMQEHMRQAKMERSQKDTAKNTRTALRKTNRALGQLSRFL